MSLISCPECGKDLSDQALFCPHCGFPLKKNTYDVYFAKETPLGPVVRKLGGAVFMFLLASVFLYGSVMIMPWFVGIFTFILGVAMIVVGLRELSGTRTCTCPYCGKESFLSNSATTYRCPFCNRDSKVVDDHLCIYD